jgi:hypothetical protein
MSVFELVESKSIAATTQQQCAAVIYDCAFFLIFHLIVCPSEISPLP